MHMYNFVLMRLFNSDTEARVGENTGLMHKDHYDKIKMNFVNLLKVTQA